MIDTIFISYDRADLLLAQQLAERLERSGFAVWWDRHLLVGAHFNRSIALALAEARCVVVIWSAASVSSDWVKDEAAEGAARGILVPVAVDDVEIPLGFRQFHTARLTGWDATAVEPDFSDVIRAIAQLLGRTTPSAGSSDQKESKHPQTSGASVTARPVHAADASMWHVPAARGVLLGAGAAIGLMLAVYGVRRAAEQPASTPPAATVSPATEVTAPTVPPDSTPVEAGAVGAGTFDFRWPGDDCWQIHRGDQRVIGRCGASRVALQPGRYTVSGEPYAVFAPFETTISAGAATVVTIGGLLDFRWPGDDCWQVHRGDQRAVGRCGGHKVALQAGRYTVSGEPYAVFAPFETTISTGATTLVAIGGFFDFKWPGTDCWQVHRDNQRAVGRCGARKVALQAGRYTVSGEPFPVFEPFSILVKDGATVTAP